ncbi:NUDIX domain-containing protein [Brevibacterium sanguinis]|uniref:NUDIX hydrolase n=1 Tax=Brevibacterium sanguinis TaxID=232444 RepID=UPI0031D3E797
MWTDALGKRLIDYPRPSVAVDTAVLTVHDSELCVATVERDGIKRLPGTFLHEGELLAEAVERSLRERVGLRGVFPRQLRTFDAVDRDDRGRVLSVAHMIALPSSDLTEVGLVPVADVHGLAFDHDFIVAEAVAALRRAYAEHPDPERLLGERFTVLELHRLHSAIDPDTAQKDTFRRAMMPLLVASDRLETGTVGKPARLYRRAQ